MSRYVNRLENGESDVGAGNSVIECALVEIQQTHKPKKARGWRRILKQAQKAGAAPRLQSLIQLSLRFFAALLGLGLLSYLVPVSYTHLDVYKRQVGIQGDAIQSHLGRRPHSLPHLLLHLQQRCV